MWCPPPPPWNPTGCRSLSKREWSELHPPGNPSLTAAPPVRAQRAAAAAAAWCSFEHMQSPSLSRALKSNESKIVELKHDGTVHGTRPVSSGRPMRCAKAPTAPHHPWAGTQRSLAFIFGEDLLAPTSLRQLSEPPTVPTDAHGARGARHGYRQLIHARNNARLPPLARWGPGACRKS